MSLIVARSMVRTLYRKSKGHHLQIMALLYLDINPNKACPQIASPENLQRHGHVVKGGAFADKLRRRLTVAACNPRAPEPARHVQFLYRL